METNIFELRKKDRKKTERYYILVDEREKNSLVIAELIDKGINVEIKRIPVADYIVGDVAIERKTIQDFISSMINKRLPRQLEELKQFEKKILIIEGYEEQDLYYRINENAVRGFLLSITLDLGVPVIMTKDYEDTASFISVLAKRINKKPSKFSLRAKKKILSDKEQLQFILEGFPGIGPETAKKLLKKFKTIRNIINAGREELKEILGKRTDLFLRLINKNYS